MLETDRVEADREDGARPEGFAWTSPLAVAGLALLATVFCLGGIDSGSLRTYDEAIYAQVAREMMESGDWGRLTSNGAPWFHKPPLVFWLMASSYRLAGVSEGTVRLPSALFGVATVLVLFVFSSRLFGRRVALVAALLLLSTPHFVEFSKVGMLDVPLTFFVTVAILSYARGLEKAPWLALSASAFGLALMTKGVAALVAPLACLAHLVLSRRLDILRSRWLWVGGALAVAIAAPWHLFQWRVHGDVFIGEYFGYHVLRRSREALEGHEGSIFFFFKTLLDHQLPWVALLPIAIPSAVWAVAKLGRRELLLPLVWAGVVFAVYSAVATKISWYILPAYPALSLCLADWLVRVVPPKRIGTLVLGILVIVALVGVTESRVFDLDYEPDVKALALEARALLPDDAILFVHDTDAPTVRFYAEREVQILEVSRPTRLRDQLQRHGLALCIARGGQQVERLLAILDDFDAEVIEQRGEDFLLRFRAPSEGAFALVDGAA